MNFVSLLLSVLLLSSTNAQIATLSKVAVTNAVEIADSKFFAALPEIAGKSLDGVTSYPLL